MRRTLLISLCLVPALIAQPAGFASQADAIVESYAADGLFRGAVIVAKEGQPVFRKAYGLANAEWDLANTPDTKFRIGSITKQFTAVAILQLADQGKLKLDDPVAKHYAAAPAAWEKVTVHHLLNHTSGIPSYTNLPGFVAKLSRDARKPEEIVALTQDKPLEFEPGAKWAYNNTGYVLLGHLIEKLSGISYADYVRRNILEPAGMKDSGYDTLADVLKKRATGYSPDGRHAPYLDMSLPHAAGSLYSTVDDLVRWDRALAAGQLISAGNWKRMTTPGLSNYGYGLTMKPIFGHASQGHNGGINGFNSAFLRFPDDHLAVAVLGNINSPAVDALADKLARLYFGQEVKPRERGGDIKLSEAELDAYTGIYEVTPAFKLTVRREGALLITQATNQQKIPVYPLSKDRFTARVMEAQLEFKRDGAGKVESLVIHQGGRATPAKRVAD